MLCFRFFVVIIAEMELETFKITVLPLREKLINISWRMMEDWSDAEDMVQETFLKLLSGKKEFASEEHEKAWLIVTASNTCKDELRRFKRRLQYISACLKPESGGRTGEEGILELIWSLPPKYKEVVYLHYYEGYQAAEIAGMLHCPASTVRNRLSRARKLLQRDGV